MSFIVIIITTTIIIFYVLFYIKLFYKGETGLVYKAYLNTAEGTEIVAVKMSKSKLA